MLKRIISGVLASVLLLLSIPIVSFAADTVGVDKFLGTLFYKCVEAGMDKGGITDDGNGKLTVTFGMDLISVQTANPNLKLTLCPILKNSGYGNYSFEHALDPHIDTAYQDDMQTSLKNNTDAYVILGSSAPGCIYKSSFNTDNQDSGKEHYRYGTIGAIVPHTLSGVPTSIDSSKILINPVYVWADLKINNENTPNIIEYEDQTNTCTTYLYAMNKASTNASTDNPTNAVLESYWIDGLSMYLFVAKMHTLYHCPDVWDALGFGRDACPNKTCTDASCPLITGMSIFTSKGTYGCSQGEAGTKCPADSLLSEQRNTKANYTTAPDFECALGITFTKLSLQNTYNSIQGPDCISKLVAFTDASKTSTNAYKKLSESNAVKNLHNFNAWYNGLISDKEEYMFFKYWNNLLVANNIKLIENSVCPITKFDDAVLLNLQYLMTCDYDDEKLDAVGLPFNGEYAVTLMPVNALNTFIYAIEEVREYVRKSAEESIAFINLNSVSGSFKVGSYSISTISRLLIPYVLSESLGTPVQSNLFDNFNLLIIQYGEDSVRDQWEACTVMTKDAIKNPSGILEGLGKALSSYSTYDEFKEAFMPQDKWDSFKVKENWTGSFKHKDTGSVYTSFNNIYKDTSRDDFVFLVMSIAILAAYDNNNVTEHAKMLFLHSLWNKMYGDNAYFSAKELKELEGKSKWERSGDITIVASAQIDSYKAQYELADKCCLTPLGRAETLKLRSDIIDFYAKYCIEDSSENGLLGLVESAYSDQLDAITEGNTDEFYTSLGNNYLNYEPLNYDKAGDLFIYQQQSLFEAKYYGDMVYLALITSVVSDGVTLEGMSRYINILSDLKAVHDKYRGSVTDDFWFAPGKSDMAKDEKDVTFQNDDQESTLDTLAGLYDYLVALGYISSADYAHDIYNEQDPLTLFWTQASGNITFSKDYYTGRALSATYIPMQTNVYDPYVMLDYVDTEWIENFHYKYGFYRKALLIDTNVDAAVDSYVSNTQGVTRVATLQDLLNCESDIVLYVDEHFYGLSELAELQDKTYDRLASTNPTMFDSIMNSISDMFSMFREVDFDVALKQTTNQYSDRIASNVTDMSLKFEYDENGKLLTNLKSYDQYILSPDSIKQYIKAEDYTPMLGYAVVSNIYRNTDAYNIINRVSATRTPVFESSPTLATISSSSTQAKNTLYNYALLKNISAMTTVGYETSTDMTSPIYCDIYGNIVTESGLVVIPAACNATLHTGDMWQPICTGFLSTYGKEWSIPTSWNLDEGFMTKMFYKNEELGQWEIRNKTIQNMEINFAQLSYADKAVNVALKEWYNYDLVNASQINQYNSLNILHEVLRGAPIENIDFDAENLNSARKVDKSGLIAAAKLDNIVNSLDWDDENSIMSIPRLSFIDNYQYVVVFIFKVLLVIVVTALMITIYVDVLKTKISWRTLGRCVGTLVLGVACVLLIPVSYDISYYQSNKLLLQDEAEYIMMLNTEKNMSGREIGVYEVTEPEQHTQILIKLEDFEFNWLEVLPSVITSDSINVMDAKYKEFLNNSLLANKDNVQAMNDGMYMDVQDIFDTSVLNFSTTSKQLYQKVSVDPVASYYIPYYYFLDALLTNMNDFNRSNNVYAYSTKIMRGGAVKTVNLCSAYFNSKEFMEGNDSDYLGLYQLYDTMGSMIILPIFNEESIEPARQSQWYVGTLMPEEDVLERVQLMDTKVKQFIMENKNLIGKVTDETFLKCMAMDLAIEYNNIFGIPSANAFEVYNLSNADLMRLTIADKASTLEGSPMSFSRFVYNEAGTPGVYASVFLVITTMFVQTMKTIITIAIMALLVISVFVFKILLRKSNNSIAGYLLTLLVICSTNILYAVILKVSLAIPQTGLAPTLCIIIQIIIQLAYLWVLTIVLGFALRDWKNIGFTKYQTIGHNLKEKFSRRHSRSPKDRYDSQPRGVDGWDYYRKLVKENEQRMKKVGTH